MLNKDLLKLLKINKLTTIYNRKFCIPVVNVFDRNAKKIQRERAAQREDVQLYDYVKEEVGYRISDRIFDIKRHFENVVDLGAGRGYVSNNILAETVGKVTVVDLSPAMLSHVKGTPGLNFQVCEMDEEKINLPANSVDLIVSSLSLHWVNDLPMCFKAVNNALKPDGAFIGAVFGGETLFELRSALHLAELERKGGISPHLSPFTQITDIAALLNQSNFTMLTIDVDEIVVGYPSMFELLWDLKGMAENNASFNRPLHLNRNTLFAASAIYEDMFKRAEGGVKATFQIIYFVGWKACATQPKPLQRGSANVSLKDLGKIISPANK